MTTPETTTLVLSTAKYQLAQLAGPLDRLCVIAIRYYDKTSAATNVTVNSQAAARYADITFAKDGFSLVNDTNTFTAIAQDAYGRRDTNVCRLLFAICH